MGNEPFEEHSWYFRNALVRANYENRGKGVHRNRRFLELFFENLLLGTHHELKNRYLHIDWDAQQATTQETGEEATLTQQVTQQVEALLDAIADEELSLKELMRRLSQG